MKNNLYNADRIISDIIELVRQYRSDLFSMHHLRVEDCTFLSVLQNARNLDGTSPISIAETLCKDKLMKMSFFQCAVTSDDFELIRNSSTSSTFLWDHEEIEGFADNISKNYCTWLNIIHIWSIFTILNEKSFWIAHINHDHNEPNSFRIYLLQLLFNLISKILLKKVDLISRTCSYEDDNFCRRTLVSGFISRNTL